MLRALGLAVAAGAQRPISSPATAVRMLPRTAILRPILTVFPHRVAIWRASIPAPCRGFPLAWSNPRADLDRQEELFPVPSGDLGSSQPADQGFEKPADTKMETSHTSSSDARTTRTLRWPTCSRVQVRESQARTPPKPAGSASGRRPNARMQREWEMGHSTAPSTERRVRIALPGSGWLVHLRSKPSKTSIDHGLAAGGGVDVGEGPGHRRPRSGDLRRPLPGFNHELSWLKPGGRVLVEVTLWCTRVVMFGRCSGRGRRCWCSLAGLRSLFWCDCLCLCFVPGPTRARSRRGAGPDRRRAPAALRAALVAVLGRRRAAGRA